MVKRRVAIVGAGVGGLAAALRRTTNDFDVTLFERAARPGDKMREVADRRFSTRRRTDRVHHAGYSKNCLRQPTHPLPNWCELSGSIFWRAMPGAQANGWIYMPTSNAPWMPSAHSRVPRKPAATVNSAIERNKFIRCSQIPRYARPVLARLAWCVARGSAVCPAS